jgi:hypothetical protein
MKNILSKISSFINPPQKTTGEKVIEVIDFVVKYSFKIVVKALEMSTRKK